MKNQKGITLIALIITIIVMLILVAVSVTIVINSDLIGTADKAGDDTNQHYKNESDAGFGFNIEYKGNQTDVVNVASSN